MPTYVRSPSGGPGGGHCRKQTIGRPGIGTGSSVNHISIGPVILGLAKHAKQQIVRRKIISDNYGFRLAECWLTCWVEILSGFLAVSQARGLDARRSSLVTINTSPSASCSSARRTWLRSVLAPLATSRNTVSHPAALSWV